MLAIRQLDKKQDGNGVLVLAFHLHEQILSMLLLLLGPQIEPFREFHRMLSNALDLECRLHTPHLHHCKKWLVRKIYG